jgi:cephalosporin hydroxylase
MKFMIDTGNNTLTCGTDGEHHVHPLYSKAAFEILSDLWVKVGWNEKYSYTFSWMGRPIIQLPEDMVRTQELIYQLKPDVIVETGVAHGGSLIYYASLCTAMGKGRVIGVDITIHAHNRKAIEAHEMSHLITLVEGDSVSQETVSRVRSLIQPDEKVLVILDSCHTRDHVRKELEAYHNLVGPGSYIVATDGIMKDVYDVPRGTLEWRTDNPVTAAEEFLREHPNFRLQTPGWPFNESQLSANITHWPSAFLMRTA